MRVLVVWLLVLVLGLFWGLRPPSPGLKRVEGGVVYGRDGLRLFAQVCLPQGATDRAVILVPGGFGPPTVEMERRCRLYAEKGVVALVPHLRGRGKSEGKVTGCLKEAEDLALLARLLPRLGVRRYAFAGYSLGACVALKAAALEGRARGVAFVIGPVDFAEQVGILRKTRPDALALARGLRWASGGLSGLLRKADPPAPRGPPWGPPSHPAGGQRPPYSPHAGLPPKGCAGGSRPQGAPGGPHPGRPSLDPTPHQGPGLPQAHGVWPLGGGPSGPLPQPPPCGGSRHGGPGGAVCPGLAPLRVQKGYGLGQHPFNKSF